MLLKLLFSVNCQATVAYRAIRSLHFHHLWVHHTVNYIIFPYMWVHHTVRNVGLPHLGLLFPVGLLPSSLCNSSFQSSLESCQQWKLEFLLTVAFRATKIPTTLRVDLPIAIRPTKSLEDTMLPVNYRSLQRSL